MTTLEALIDHRTGRTPMEQLLAGSKAIFLGNLRILKTRMVNRAQTTRRRFGLRNPREDMIYSVLEDLVYEMQEIVDKMEKGERI